MPDDYHADRDESKAEWRRLDAGLSIRHSKPVAGAIADQAGASRDWSDHHRPAATSPSGSTR